MTLFLERSLRCIARLYRRPNGPVSSAISALELHHITKRFGSVTALDDVTFTVASGTVHALLGENGAGKSTLMRIAYGLLPPDTGEIRFFGEAVSRHSVQRAVYAGVGMVHQHLSLSPNLSVTENLVLGGSGLFRPEPARALLQKTMAESGLIVPDNALVRDLSIVEQQRLEVLKALARGARVLILDEPTAVLAPAEIDDLQRWIRHFASGGGSVVLVTHKLREALAVADDVTVLRRGRVAHVGDAKASTEQQLARAIFPERVADLSKPPPAPAAEPVVRATAIDVEDVRGSRRIKAASFELRSREVVGIAAVEGSGHRELLHALAGLRLVSSGTLILPKQVGFIPADRNREALILELTLTENVALHQLGQRRGVIDWGAFASRTAELIRRFHVVAPSARTRARTLSGGNQQRLVVARELGEERELVVADNPTRGLDLQATAFVHDQLRQAAARGALVIVHSSDLDELLALVSRVFVVFHGIVREVRPDREEVGRAMLGAA